ncbi:MAG: ATP-binding protein [bacterium]
MKTKSLKTRFFMIIVATLVAPAFLTVIFSYLGMRRTMSSMIEQSVHDDLRRWHQEAAAVRQQHQANLCGLFAATHHYVHQFRSFENEQKLFERHLENKLADFLCAHAEIYAQALWIAADGRPKMKFVLSPTYFMTNGRPLKLEKKNFDSIDENLAKVALAGTGAEIWSGLPQITSNGFAETFGIPLRETSVQGTLFGWSDNCSEQFGILFLELRLDFLFSEAARRAQIFTDATPMIFDSSGTIIYHPEPEFVCQNFGMLYPALAPYFSAPQKRAAIPPTQFEREGRQWMILSTRPAEKWRFALMLEEEKLIRRLQPLYWVNFMIMLGGIIVAGALLSWAFHQLGRTIGSLAAGAHAIAKGDLDKRVAISSDDELGALGHAFNHMAESLKNMIHERAEKEKLQELNQLKDAFISNVSHELKGPLARIDLGVENLQRGVAGAANEIQRSYLARIQENTRRLLRMIDELLEVSRIEAGRMALEFSSCSMNKILTEVIEEARPQWQSKGLRVSNGCVQENLQLLADGDKLKQVIGNLLDNAIKFTGVNGEISLRAERQNGCVEITVADTGIGIAPEHLDHLFERFYQVRANNNGNGKNAGLGLGLNIVKSLVELHDGEITVESKVGLGTRVTVKLPAKSAESKAQSV